MVKKTISLVLFVEVILVFVYLYSFSLFINIQIAFLSAFFVILGSAYSYKKMVEQNIQANNIMHQRDPLDEIEDRFELYDETPINDASAEELDLKEIVKEERGKIKTFDTKSMKYGIKGGMALARLLPYLFLVMGFIGLKNNGYLDLVAYLPALFLGIVVGTLSTKSNLS